MFEVRMVYFWCGFIPPVEDKYMLFYFVLSPT